MLSVVAGGGDGVDTLSSFSAEATEIVVATANAAKIIERMAFPPYDAPPLKIEPNAARESTGSRWHSF
jgi:hypothetical protein